MTRPRNGGRGLTPLAAGALAVILSVLFGAVALASTGALDGKTPTGLAPGSPSGSYPLSGFETVNLYSGGLNFALPLLRVGGRGSAGYTVVLPFEQKWVAKSAKPNLFGSGQQFSPDPNWWQGVDGGLRMPYGPGMLQGRRGNYVEDEEYYRVACRFESICRDDGCTGNDEILVCPDLTLLHVRTLTRLTFTAPDGTEYELRDQKTNGEPQEAIWRAQTGMVEGFSRGTVFVTADGSSVTFIADSPITDYIAPDLPLSRRLISPSGYLLLPDGTRYRIDSGRVAWVRDRNGNVMSFTYGLRNRVATAADPVGRTVTFAYADFNDADPENDHDEITFRGFGGEERKVRVLYDTLEHRLRPNSGYSVKTHRQLFGFGPLQSSVYNPRRISEVALPDDTPANPRRYKLYYNPYGELARVELPTGGATEYEWEMRADSSVGYIFRYVTERRLYADGGATPESVTGYERSGDGATSAVTVKTWDSSRARLLSQSTHHFHGDAPESLEDDPARPSAVSYAKWREGREYRTEVYDVVDNAPVLKQVITSTWRQPAAGAAWPLEGAGEADEAAKPNSPQVAEVLTALSDANLVSKQAFAYDRYGNRTDAREYDYGATPGAAGPLLKHSQTRYVTTNTTSGVSYDYACDPDATCKAGSINPDVVHLRRLPLRQSVYDADGRERARTTFEYDNHTPDPAGNNRHAELVAYGDIFGLCLRPGPTGACGRAADASYKTRGNPTGTTAYLLDKDGNVIGAATVNQQYDIAGNVVKSIDARVRPGGGGYEMSFDFGDRFGAPDDEARGNNAPQELGSLKTYALPTSVVNALGHTGYTQYDYYTAQAVNSEDAGGQVTRLEYDDPLSRLTRVTPPSADGKTEYIYVDTVGELQVKVKKQLDENVWDEGVTFYDGLGRATKTLSHDARGDVFAETAYDPLGRTWKTSNPYRTGEEKHWVETTYDALGRVKEVTSPKIAGEAAPAKIKSEYSVANTGGVAGVVQVGINQAGHRVRSITDALGRLVRLDEPNEAGDLGPIENPARPTSYTYDALGNLRKVTQGGQARYFLYDSLGRLVRVRQPEQDINPALTMPDPLTGNSDWSAGMTYDGNGNVTTTTDAKGVVTSYEYDDLNRVVRRSYSVPQTADPRKATLPTPDLIFKYDGLLSPTPGNPSPTPVPLALGKLTEVSNATSTTQYTSFDNSGRVRSSLQIVEGREYPFGYKYNLAGALEEETYPSGRVVTSAFDETGDLTSVSGRPANQQPKTYVSDFRYAADGAVEQIKLGNQRWETYKYNARQQVTQIGLGNSPTDMSLWKVNYDYGRLNPDGTVDASRNDGNVIRQTITVPGAASPFVQTYAYDPLNRLTEAAETGAGRPTWKQTFAYDRYGNRTDFSQVVGQTQSALNNVNRPEVDPLTNRFKAGQGYEYDLDGNLIRDAEGRRFGFDADNRQQQVRDASDNTIATYGYDGGGRRVRKTVNATGEVTVFVYDAAGKLAAEYSNVPPPNPATRYLTADILNTPRVITDGAGAVLSRKDYMPFGEELLAGRGTEQRYGLGSGVRQGFTGYEKDDETQLNFAEARYYNPSHGRFTAVDPLLTSGKSLNPQTFNRYAYAGNNPTLRVDPNGEDWFISHVQKLYHAGTSAKIPVIEWSSLPGMGRTRVRDYILYAQSAAGYGLHVLDPFEDRATLASSPESALRQLEAYKRQAALNFLAGAAEAGSLVLEWTGALDGAGIERDSEQYRFGQKHGAGLSMMAGATGVGLSNAIVSRFGRGALSLIKEARIAVAGFRLGGKTYKEIAVIGKLPGTLYRIGQDGVEVFRAAGKYDNGENMKWIDGLIERGAPVELVSPINDSTMLDKFGGLTAFGREVRRLEAAGYRQWGIYMLPPR